ncbi:WD repeat-containing protein 64-like isoform X2 [Gigantopelta aegis]|uniref:WD repeat-containing protein 64-like isoform X2 n=1 Tax=Gigantopelta aegis TaxID=1735272 RepID=UPI001B889406|nr:WD repeat-containing protein 64-like isoform X2 [Gigantopelta aegis]
MSTLGESGSTSLQRPYTVTSFQHKLDIFEGLIREITYQDSQATPEERRQWITENLRFDQFCEKIRDIFGPDVKNHDLKAIYRKISTNPDAKVDWSELFGYFQSGADEEEITVGEEISVFMVAKRRRVGEAAGDRKRRDTVQCIKYIQGIDSYLSVSQKGALSIWTNKLRLQSCVDINEAAWATGCDYLPSIRRVACCTERSIVIWDNRAKGKNQHIFSIKPIEHSPQCMVSVPLATSIHEDCILFGDDQGYVNILTVTAKDLTMKNTKGEKKNTHSYVIDPTKLAQPIVRRRLHDDWVLRVKYFPELRCFASCSPSSVHSFVLEELGRIYDNVEIRGVSVPKGVNCFDYCSRANIIATAGVDKIIRVWHPHIFSRPTGKLLGHLFTITDVACNERDQHIISLSTARVFRVWDIHTLTCLQVFTDNEERPGEKRIYSMLFDNKYDRLLTGSSVIDSWPLTRAVQDTMQVPHTHDRPLSQVLYNSELNQVVSVCTESFLKVWEMDTGKVIYSITEAHGPGIEITAITLDKSGYRLVSGGYDGSIKIWDFGAGQMIKSKSGRGVDEDLSITGLVYYRCENDHVLLACGWNNRIKMILDPSDSHDLPVLHEFSDVYYWPREASFSLCSESKSPTLNETKSSSRTDTSLPNAQITNVFRKDYILSSHEVTCMVAFKEEVLFTGTGNGSIVMWDMKKSLVNRIFQLPPADPESTDIQVRLLQSGERRVNAIGVLVHKVRKPDPAYIKKLTELHHVESDQDEVSTSAGESHPVSRDSGTTQSHKTTSRDGPPGEHETSQKNTPSTAKSREQRTQPHGRDVIVNMSGAESTSSKGSSKRVRMEDDNVDPDAKMIVEEHQPLVVTAHQDSFIRFWNFDGDLLREVMPMTRRTGTAITALCYDKDVNILVTGDHKGYITMWDVKKFLESPEAEDAEPIKQLICWRAHLVRIVSLVYVDAHKSILSGSTDGSLRVWWGKKGKFIGFFSQHRPFLFPVSEELAGSPSLPYDITETPQAPVAKKTAGQKITTVQKFEYPLIFDNEKWRPFRRSAYIRQTTQRPQPEDKKFFGALIKPRAYNHHLESSTTGEKLQGAVFRALPVYRVCSPETPRTPVMNYSMMTEDEENYYGNSTLFGAVKQSQVKPKKSVTRNVYAGVPTRFSQIDPTSVVSPKRR